jgi:hypothetical protein
MHAGVGAPSGRTTVRGRLSFEALEAAIHDDPPEFEYGHLPEISFSLE